MQPDGLLAAKDRELVLAGRVVDVELILLALDLDDLAERVLDRRLPSQKK